MEKPLRFRLHLETTKFLPDSARAVAFLCRVLACEERSVPPIHVPCRRRGASASFHARSVHTLGWHAALSLTVYRDHWHTHRNNPWASHWLPCSQVRERATTENGLAGLARAPGAPAPTPPPPPLQRGPHCSCPCAAHYGLRFGRRRGRAGWSRGRGATRWRWTSLA